MTNSIGTAEYFVFSMGTATRLSPFDGTTSFGTKQVLNSISRTNPGTGEGTGLAHSFSYNDYGELLSVGLPYGGTLRWTYRTFTYSGSRSLREVQSRYLTMSPGGSEIGYGFSFDDTAGSTLHSWGKLTNPGGAGREWYFSNGTNGPLGVLWRFEAGTGFPSSPSPMVRRDFSYSQDSASRYYISSVVKTIDPGGANPLQSKTWQQLNSHGNVTQSKIYDYGNLTTPVRTFTNTFWTNSTQHIWNRLHTSAVTDGTNQVTLVNNRYDLYDLTDYSPFTIPSHDSAYDASFTARGNLSESTSFGTVHHFSYDIAGNTLAADDTHGHGVSSSYSGATQYAVPDSISPNGDDTLATDYTYSSFLGISGVDTPDMSASMDYDSFGRPATAHSPYGATTTYAYDGDNVRLITATTGSKIVKTTMDGLGRTVKVETGDSTGTKLVVETVYDYCACSPLGKVKKVSRPYKPSATVYWTEYEYDALGRTTRVTLPDGSYSTFAFSGNTTTVTDPAAHSKTYKRDVLGNLTEVDEPAPEGGTHVTSYTYNLLGKLAQVSMARGGATQTRTFSYDLSTGRLSYVQNPESGRVDFTYNIDGTLQYKTDAKGQKVQFTYDSLGRVTVKQTYRSDQTEDLCGRVTNYWDTRPAGVGDQNWTNVKGRLMAVRWSDNSCTAKQFTEAYQYDTGEITIKRLYAPALAPQGEASYIDATFNYGDQGQLVSAAYPVWYGSQNKRWPLAVDAKTYTISYDMLMRLIGLSDGQNAIVHDVAYGSTDEVTAPAGQLSAFSYGSYTETLNYNARGQLTELKAASDGETMVDLQYVFAASPSNDGRITQMIDTVANETVNYQHDSLGRLTSADTPPGGAWGQTFTYDGFGNLTSEVATKDGSPIVYRNYDAATNRLLPSTDYTYDANGNLTAMPDLSMTYNVENRMVQVVNQEGTESYGYDPGGVQVWKLDKYNVMHVFFNGGEGKPMGDFYYDVSLQAARGGSPMVYFAGRRVDNDSVEDRLGTAVLDNGKKMSFYPYGMVRSNDDSSPVQYATYNRDALTNLDYAQQRYYSSQIGRFTTADPNTDPDWSNPQSLNQFTYVGGDPIDANDPEGLCAVMIAGITMDPERGSVWDSEAGVLRADTAYPYSGYSGFGPLKKVQSIFSVIRQGFGSNDSTAAALAAIRYALSSNAGLVDIIAYSGGAGAFTAAYGQLSDAEKNRIGYVLYLSPGAEGLIADAKGTTTAVVGSPFNVADDATVAFTTFPQDVPVIGSDCAHTDIACLFRAAKTFLRNINSNGPCNNPKVFTRTRPLGVPANFLSSRGWPPGYGLGGYWEWVPVYGSEGEIGGYVPVYWGPILPPRAFER